MSTTRSRLVEELFQGAYDLEGEKRARFLDRHCRDDAELRAEVEAILSHERAASDEFLTGRAPRRAARERLARGQRVGRFSIVGVLGEGGMGTVYEAHQEHPRRTVALKLIRSECADPEILSRFRHEADVLAALQHPGIAQIYEAGTTRREERQQPFFAMELVRGRELVEHARGLGPRGRIELVARICDAVQHAHQRGIIHRDLKPENILVVPEVAEPGTGRRPDPEFRDVGQPKILDFGIARATGPDARRSTLETEVGHLVGTLEYMSPEQVGGDPGAVDTRSDVYALGVLLYELLAERPPLDLSGAALLECARRIREDRPEPLRAAAGEVAAVCSKALEKDAEDRYASAGELAEDLRRFLRGEPVSARSHSALYVLRKSLRRHRTAAAVAALLLALLAAFGAVSSIQATRNRRLARTLAVELRTNNIERGREMARARNFGPAEELIWREHLAAPESRHSFWALWELYSLHCNLGTWSTAGDQVRTTAFHPGGGVFATGGDDGRVQLWDANGRGRRNAIEIGEPVLALDYDGAGAALAGVTLAGRVFVVDTARGEVVRSIDAMGSLEARPALATSIRFLPDDHAVVTAGDDGLVQVFDAGSGARRAALAGHAAPVLALAIAPDGSRLASAGTEREILVWRDLVGPPTHRLPTDCEIVLALAFSPDGRRLATGGNDKLIHVFDLATGREVDTLAAPNGSVRYLAWPGADELLSGGWWSVLGWDLARGARSDLLTTGLWAGARDARGDRFVTGEDLVRLWDLAPRDGLRLERHAGRVVARLRPDGRVLVTGDEEGVVRTFDAATGRPLERFAVDRMRIRCLDYDPSGTRLLVGCHSGVLRVVDPTTGAVLLELDRHQDYTRASAVFLNGGRSLAHVGTDGLIREYDTASGALVREWRPSPAQTLGIAVAPDGTVATTARDDRVRLWSPGGALLRELPADSGPWSPVFSDDGTRLAVGMWTPGVHVYDVASGELERTLTGHRAAVWDVDFVRGDANTLASASDDGTIKLWDVAKGHCLATLDDFDGWDAFSVSFGPDRVLVTGGRRGAVIHDLTYFERHMAANLDHFLHELGGGVGTANRRRLEDWAAEVLGRPWPRFGPD